MIKWQHKWEKRAPEKSFLGDESLTGKREKESLRIKTQEKKDAYVVSMLGQANSSSSLDCSIRMGGIDSETGSESD